MHCPYCERLIHRCICADERLRDEAAINEAARMPTVAESLHGGPTTTTGQESEAGDDD